MNTLLLYSLFAAVVLFLIEYSYEKDLRESIFFVLRYIAFTIFFLTVGTTALYFIFLSFF